ATNPHILNLAPPPDMDPKWFGPHVAYSMAKYGMSMCVLGMAQEFAADGIGVNALWPRTGIATAAIELIGGRDTLKACRKPAIVADATHIILTRDARRFSGQFCIDDSLLHTHGVTDFRQYAVDPDTPLWPDFFVPDNRPAPPGSMD